MIQINFYFFIGLDICNVFIEIQSNPIQTDKNWIGLDWFGFKKRKKPIGWWGEKIEVIGSNDFSSQNRTNPNREHP